MAAIEDFGVFMVLVGLVLLAVEVLHPGVFLLIPGTMVLGAGLLLLLLPQFLLQTIYGPSVVILLAVAAALVTIPYYRRIAPTHAPMSTTANGLTGEVGVLIAAVRPDSLQGKVRIRSEIWSARADRAIPAGTHVRIVSGEGVSVRVEPIETASSGAA
ncbi:MAG: NfeD family protein [Thermoplasmata archaeon]|nr:NfeD family protein [Thermoplasmata archaeon]